MTFQVKFAERCAWRAVYVYRVKPNGSPFPTTSLQFSLGVDPTTDYGPKCFGSLGRFSWRFTLPHVMWGTGRVRRWAANLSARFWHSIDGRYTTRKPS